MAIDGSGMNVSGVRRPFRSLGIAASGLSGQRARIEAIASNIANANTIKTDGTPYQKRVAVLREAGFDPVLRAQMQDGPAQAGLSTDAASGGVQIEGVMELESEGKPVYMPDHPDADADGYVMMPDIEIETEMMDLMEARRLYDANATVFEAVKSMLRRAAQI